MEVILLERIEKLGQMGDVVTVKPGYARNYLLPQKKALRATKENIAFFESQRAEYEARNLEQKREAEGIREKLDGVRIVLIRQAGDSGQLYGSASARDIAQTLTEEGFRVDRRQVRLTSPIKLVGLHQVQIVLHPEVVATITVNVARSEDEASLQFERGTAIIGDYEEQMQAVAEAESAARAESGEETPADEEAAGGGEGAAEAAEAAGAEEAESGAGEAEETPTAG